MEAGLLLPRALASALGTVATRSRRKAAKKFFESMGPMRKRVMQLMWEAVKDAATQDPDMLDCAKVQARGLIDSIAEDVELQAEEQMRINTMKTMVFAGGGRRGGTSRAAIPSQLESACCLSLCCRSRLCCAYMGLRAFVLNHVFPHDRTLWGCMRDPWWWLVILLTMVTAYGIRIGTFSLLLVFLLFPGPPDEYHLTKFITFIKANQVATAGVGMAFGAVEYYICIIFQKADLLECIHAVTFAPFALWFSLGDFLGSFLLPQAAMLAFFCSMRLKPCRASRQEGGDRAAVGQASTEDAEMLPCCCCCHVRHPAPVRLRGLVRYDVTCFAVAIVMMLVMTTLSTPGVGIRALICDPFMDHSCSADPTLIVNAYWCKVFYGFTALPFTVVLAPDFTPASFSIVTRAARTGYNRAGDCVLFKVRWDGKANNADHGDHLSSDEDSLDSDSSASSEGLAHAKSVGSSGSGQSGPLGKNSRQGRSVGAWGLDWRYLC